MDEKDGEHRDTRARIAEIVGRILATAWLDRQVEVASGEVLKPKPSAGSTRLGVEDHSD